ncbi:MAG TPA: hypothetical protein VHB49_13600 [Bradyrhizobium sp.]|nr:hypothetical protein [Bradyrhizobium sp.]
MAAFISKYCSIIGVTRDDVSEAGAASGGEESDKEIEDWIVIQGVSAEGGTGLHTRSNGEFRGGF